MPTYAVYVDGVISIIADRFEATAALNSTESGHGGQTKIFLFDFRCSLFMLFGHVSTQLQNTGVYSC